MRSCLPQQPFLAAVALFWLTASAFAQPAPASDAHRYFGNSEPAYVAEYLFDPETVPRRMAVQWFVERGSDDAVPALILSLRFNTRGEALEMVQNALTELTGAGPFTDWFDWMVWLEQHPEIRGFPGYDSFHTAYLSWIDPEFTRFIYEGVERRIRVEEVVWGGVRKDGIPDLSNPAFLEPGERGYISDDELVFGVEINGDARAYPLRILDWHELLNDVIGGVSVSLAYCTLCGSGILFETALEGFDEPLSFGNSGLLYRSNKLMYDRATHSLWNQFTGRPVIGPLATSGIELKIRPVAITSWAEWFVAHPDTRLLSLDTGHRRDYTPNAAYGDYFARPDLIFPAELKDERLAAKDYVFALRGSGQDKAWPLILFEGGAVINDQAGVVPLVLIGDAATRTVRAYRTDGRQFEAGPDADTVQADGTIYEVTEDALVGPGGATFGRLPGHIAYWFAFAGFLEGGGELAEAP